MILEQTSIITLLLIPLFSCSNSEKTYDATGSFEAIETIISSEAIGRIEKLDLEEGMILSKGQRIGFVDTTQLLLKKQQILKQIEALNQSLPKIDIQLAPLRTQVKTAEKEQLRISNLLKSNAATDKQMDDINAQVKLLKSQLTAMQTSLRSSLGSAKKNIEALEIQYEQVQDQLAKSYIKSPINGTVLTQFARSNEFTAIGKPLYKIADLSSMTLRTYITGDQLAKVKLKQRVLVFTDDGNGDLHESQGEITWISDKSEFTPKSIQTKDERANRVYAIKVKVNNDGRYKIGMYGEIRFTK